MIPSELHDWARDAALETRRLEIDLFWRRATFFWAFQLGSLGVLGAGLALENESLQFLLACAGSALGFWAAVAAYFSARGAKYWQAVWEKRLQELEPFKMFGSSTEIVPGIFGPGPWSVSRQTIVFIAITVFVWAGAVVVAALNLQCEFSFVFPLFVFAVGGLQWGLGRTDAIKLNRALPVESLPPFHAPERRRD